MQADNTARITVRANDANSEPLAPVRFDLTIVQNPFEVSGDPVENPGGWPDAGDCAVVSQDATTLNSREDDGTALVLTGTTILVDGGDCTSSGTSVDVALQNDRPATTADNEVSYLVYVTGGDSFPDVDGFTGKSGLSQELHEVGGQDALGDPGEAIITVPRSMADSKGQVYLYGYFGQGFTDQRIRTSSEAFTNQAVSFIVLVQFVDGPALAFDSKVDDKTFIPTDGGDDVNGSTLEVVMGTLMGDADADMDGYHDNTYEIDSSDAEIMVMAIIRDAKGNPLNAGDKDSRVDFSVMYAAGSDISDSAADYNSRQVMKKGSNTATLANLDGWNSGDKAVRVTVAAVYTSPSAPDGFELGTLTLIRVADAASTANFMTYSCAEKKDAPGGKGCMANYAASEDMRFGREDYFVVNGQFEDALGSMTEDRPEVKVTGDATDAIDNPVGDYGSWLHDQGGRGFRTPAGQGRRALRRVHHYRYQRRSRR